MTGGCQVAERFLGVPSVLGFCRLDHQVLGHGPRDEGDREKQQQANEAAGQSSAEPGHAQPAAQVQPQQQEQHRAQERGQQRRAEEAQELLR